ARRGWLVKGRRTRLAGRRRSWLVRGRRGRLRWRGRVPAGRDGRRDELLEHQRGKGIDERRLARVRVCQLGCRIARGGDFVRRGGGAVARGGGLGGRLGRPGQG